MSDDPRATAPRHPLRTTGYGEVLTTDPHSHSRNGSSLFADPVAWLMTEAVARAAADCDTDLTAAGDHVGLIAISDLCTMDTMRTIARATPRGRLSPLKFAGANPGSVAGLPCIRHGFRGPTLALAMPPAPALPAALAMAEGWIARGSARHVLIAAHRRDGDAHGARAYVLESARTPQPSTEPDLSRLAAPVPAPAAAGR
ncbi:polyketide synthase [Streptomyces sp. RS10V-4]|uniref:polyketide synthase n=1 Tax=Streptomyces rhizoryzae TaxID=2932493 RepID=UPI0020064EE1|nr:polyketide synthase [Streptomyces rhizoryzae]MCK7624963.1 polyketide synthase [Streptomyces rhizoryzae]